MTRAPIIMALAISLILAGCGRSLDTEHAHYDSYGLFNASRRSPNVCYEVSAGNVIWSIFLIETVFFPVYFIGFSIMNPMRMKSGPSDTCGAA